MRPPNKLIAYVASALLFIVSNSASAQDGPGLEVSDPQWSHQTTVGTRAHSTPVDRGHATNYPPTAEVSALFHNTGQKAIRSVTWKYIFYADDGRTKVLASYGFHSSNRIAVGASVRLKKGIFTLSEPREWSNYQAVVIVRVKYSDGTIWTKERSK